MSETTSEAASAAVSASAQGVAVSPKAHALGMFRIANGEGRRYTATTFPADPYRGCERFVRMCRAVGWITPQPVSLLESYGLLEVLDENGDILQDFDIPTAGAFRQIKTRLNIRVEIERNGVLS